MIIILSLCLSFWRQRPYLPIAQLQICQHLWFSHPHQSYLFPLRLLHTGHIDLSLSQCLYHLPAVPDSESIFHANCEAPSILQAIQLVTFKITALCLRTVSCCSWSGVSHLVFRLDALALSVIATATWLAGWVAGWLAGWLSHSGTVLKRLNLSENFFDHLKAPSF